MGKGGSAPEYKSTTSSNPYATGTHTSNGSSYTLNPFLTGTNQFVEQNVPALYQQLLNPSLDNPVTKARSDLFYNTFNEDSKKAFENNLVNPLAQRGLMRSSAMDSLSNKFAQDQNKQISQFDNQLIANNTADTNAMINQLMNLYMTGANLGQQAISNAKGDAQQVNNYAMQAYQQESANNNAMWSNLANIGGQALGAGGSVKAAALLASDVKVKENIKPIGKENGHNIYEFTYKDGLGLPKGKHTGVIAQEVEKTRPDAVVEIDGVKHVDYGKIGVNYV